MKIAIYSARSFERKFLEEENEGKFNLVFIEEALSLHTAGMAQGCEAVSVFVSDNGSAAVLDKLHAVGVRYLLLRSAGYNHVDVAKAKSLGMLLARVPEYSPYAIAEHAVALMLALNRKLIQAHKRIMEQNFSLEGLVGFDMHGKTVGILGTGKIGHALSTILNGFGCRILAYDVVENEALRSLSDFRYASPEEIYAQSDILSLHIPLTPETHHIINKTTLEKMKPGAMLINTSRGGLVHSADLIAALKSGHLGSAGIDVYEEEEGVFFQDLSGSILQDDVLARLMMFPNVLITSHQGFLTDTALKNIAHTTLENARCFASGAMAPGAL